MIAIDRYVTIDGDDTDAQATFDAAVDIAHACSLSVALKYNIGLTVGIVAGADNTPYIRTGVDATNATAATINAPSSYVGLASDGSDLTVQRQNKNGPLNTTGFPILLYSTDKSLFIAGAYTNISGLVIQGEKNGYIIDVNANYVNLYGLSVQNSIYYTHTSGIRMGYAGAVAYMCDVKIIGSGSTDGYAFNSSSSAAGSPFINCRAEMIADTSGGCFSIRIPKISGCIAISNGSGIGFSLGTTYADIDHCVAYGCNIGLSSPNSSQLSCMFVRNSIFASCDTPWVNLYSATADHSVISMNNLFYNNTNQITGYVFYRDENTINSDPLFLDASVGDFRIGPASPARNAGTDNSDIGACQRPEGTVPVVDDVRSGTEYNVGGQEGTLTGEFAASSGGSPQIGSILIRRIS